MYKIWMVLGCSLFLTACNQPIAQSQQEAAVQKSTAIHAVLLDQPNLFHDETNLKIDQQFNRAENQQMEITVEQAQLDDSVAAIRTEYELKRDQEVWKIVNKNKAISVREGQYQ